MTYIFCDKTFSTGLLYKNIRKTSAHISFPSLLFIYPSFALPFYVLPIYVSFTSPLLFPPNPIAIFSAIRKIQNKKNFVGAPPTSDLPQLYNNYYCLWNMSFLIFPCNFNSVIVSGCNFSRCIRHSFDKTILIIKTKICKQSYKLKQTNTRRLATKISCYYFFVLTFLNWVKLCKNRLQDAKSFVKQTAGIDFRVFSQRRSFWVRSL